jgi:hypothetical protein
LLLLRALPGFAYRRVAHENLVCSNRSVARMELSELRVSNASAIPDYDALHPGFKATHPQIFRPACSQ